MLYADTVATFEVPQGHQFQDAKMTAQYAVSAFIEKFPFHVGWPLTTQIFRYVDDDGKPQTVGFLSDIRNQHQDPIENPHQSIYTPLGTTLYLKDTSWIPDSWLVKSDSDGVIPFPGKPSEDGIVRFDK